MINCNGPAALVMSSYERNTMIKAVEQSQVHQHAALENAWMNLLSVDVSDSVYQSFRSTTAIGLEIGSMVAGGYGAVKGVIGFSKLARTPTQIQKIAQLSTLQLKGGNGFLRHKGFEF